MNSPSRFFLVLVLYMVAASMQAQVRPPQRFENATAGIALTRPNGWQTGTLQAVQENRSRIRLSDSELEAGLRKLATAPLFVFMKHPEPHPTVNPSVQVILRPTGSLNGADPTEILKVAVGTIQKAFADFTFITSIQNVSVSDMPAAHMRARYTLNTADGSAQVLSRLWVVPRGPYMFLIGMSGPADGPDVSEAEFTEVLRSITIQK
jgi:hypothetical protein